VYDIYKKEYLNIENNENSISLTINNKEYLIKIDLNDRYFNEVFNNNSKSFMYPSNIKQNYEILSAIYKHYINNGIEMKTINNCNFEGVLYDNGYFINSYDGEVINEDVDMNELILGLKLLRLMFNINPIEDNKFNVINMFMLTSPLYFDGVCDNIPRPSLYLNGESDTGKSKLVEILSNYYPNIDYKEDIEVNGDKLTHSIYKQLMKKEISYPVVLEEAEDKIKSFKSLIKTSLTSKYITKENLKTNIGWKEKNLIGNRSNIFITNDDTLDLDKSVLKRLIKINFDNTESVKNKIDTKTKDLYKDYDEDFETYEDLFNYYLGDVNFKYLTPLFINFIKFINDRYDSKLVDIKYNKSYNVYEYLYNEYMDYLNEVTNIKTDDLKCDIDKINKINLNDVDNNIITSLKIYFRESVKTDRENIHISYKVNKAIGNGEIIGFICANKSNGNLVKFGNLKKQLNKIAKLNDISEESMNKGSMINSLNYCLDKVIVGNSIKYSFDVFKFYKFDKEIGDIVNKI
jgi:hypothetical protein